MQAAARVDIATVLAADEDFELRIDGAGVSDEAADHLDDCMWGGMDGDHTVDVPKNLYRRHEYIQSGISSFKKIVKKEKAMVYESLYLNF